MAEFNLNVPAVEKLLDYTAMGIGAVAGPMLAPWKASREGKARLASARFDAEVRRVEAESRGQSLKIIAEAQARARQSLETMSESEHGRLEITRDDITQSIEFQGRKRLANAKAVVEGAADELGDTKVADHEPDPDWVARFFDHVQDVSSEDMRRIWAKILAGEVENPGQTSLRTLDTLKNMAKVDAELFSGICDFVIRGDFVFYDSSMEEIKPLVYGRLLYLQECGLLSIGPNLRLRFEFDEAGFITLDHQKSALMITRDREATGRLEIPAVRLTTVGQELSRLAQPTLQMRYLQMLATYLKSNNCRLDYYERVTRLDDGRTQLSGKIPIASR